MASESPFDEFAKRDAIILLFGIAFGIGDIA
jgi:hypothetical protein